MKKIIVVITAIIMLQGCSKDHKTKTSTQDINLTLPFPPIDNYGQLDDNLKPPSLK